MRHIVRVITLILFAAVIAGCQKQTVKPDYERYTELVRQQEQERQARIAALANTADCNGDATCIVAAKAIAGMAEASGPKQTVAPPPPKRTFGDRVESVANTLVRQLPALGGLYVSDRSSERQAQTQQRQYEFLENVTVAGLETAAEVAQAGPRIDVGGDYTGGDRTETNIGDDYTGGDRTDIGGDSVGGDQHIGDSAGRDQIGGDSTDNSGIIGDNNETRVDSPGPISDDGNDCNGESCNPSESDGDAE